MASVAPIEEEEKPCLYLRVQQIGMDHPHGSGFFYSLFELSLKSSRGSTSRRDKDDA